MCDPQNMVPVTISVPVTITIAIPISVPVSISLIITGASIHLTARMLSHLGNVGTAATVHVNAAAIRAAVVVLFFGALFGVL